MGFRKRNKTEAGEAELGFFVVVLVLCGIVSAALFILNWVKDTKDAKVARRGIKYVTDENVPKRAPGTYWADCNKPLWAVFGTTMQCEIDPESYVEKELEEFR